MTTTRANTIIAIAESQGQMFDLWKIATEAQDGNKSTSLHRAIRERFTGDDDFDDLLHEIDHATGKCSDDDEECMWAAE